MCSHICNQYCSVPLHCIPFYSSFSLLWSISLPVVHCVDSHPAKGNPSLLYSSCSSRPVGYSCGLGQCSDIWCASDYESWCLSVTHVAERQGQPVGYLRLLCCQCNFMALLLVLFVAVAVDVLVFLLLLSYSLRCNNLNWLTWIRQDQAIQILIPRPQSYI